MRQVAVITDTVACLPPDLARRHNIGIVPLNILYDNRVYRDWVDITPTQAYELFLKAPHLFHTSTPGPTDFASAYREAAKLAPSVLCITLSTKLSTTHGAALLGRDYAAKDMPGTRIEVLDSETATAAEGFIALAAARAADAGLDMDAAIAAALRVRDRVEALVLLDTMRHVYRSGRVPRFAAQAGSVLNIRAIFSLRGSVHLECLVRSRERGLQALLEKMQAKVNGRPVHAAVMHAYAREAAEKLMEDVRRTFNCVELWLTEFSPLMGYATGTGTLAVAFYSGE